MAVRSSQNGPLRLISRLLNKYPAPRIQQNPSSNIERLLRARDNHDLTRVALDCSGGSEVGADSTSEPPGAKRVDLMKSVSFRVFAVAGNQA